MDDTRTLWSGGVPMEPWQIMLLLAMTIYAVCKVATWWPARRRLGVWRGFAYLLAWPGMDPAPFAARRSDVRAPSFGQVLTATLNMAGGAALLAYAVPNLAPASPRIAGLLGVAGLTLVVHFGAFQLTALVWQRLGFDVRPIMNAPLRATSMADFWSRRWNLAFRDLAHRYVFHPLLAHAKPLTAMLVVFVVSGVVHDMVISVPAGAGYGLPTLYFLLQAAGFYAQRMPAARRIGLASGALGWVTTVTIVAVPINLLFHEPFLNRVILPWVATLNFY